MSYLNKLHEKKLKATFVHMNILAKIYGVSNIAMFNAVAMGGFRQELMEIMNDNSQL